MKRKRIVSLVMCIVYVATLFAWNGIGDAVAKTVTSHLHGTKLTFDGAAPYGIPMHRGVSYIGYDTGEGTLRVRNAKSVGGSFYIGKDGTVGSNIVTQNVSDEKKAEVKESLLYLVPGSTYELKFDYKFLAGTEGINKEIEVWLVPDPTAASVSNYYLSKRATLLQSNPATMKLGETETTLTEDSDWKTASYTFKVNENETETLAVGIRVGYSEKYATAVAFDNFSLDEVSTIEYNESRLHTMDDPISGDAIINGSGVIEAATVDGDEAHGKVMKLVAAANARLGFSDLSVKKNRKYYIYYDAKSESSDTVINTLIGVNGNGTLSCRYFFTGYEYKNSGIKLYIDGEQVEAKNFKMSDAWARYGIIIDTSNEALLSSINKYSEKFWDNDIHFLFGASNATVYFDNLKLVEIEDIPAAVPSENNEEPTFSIRSERAAADGQSYRSAGLRFRGSVTAEQKASADEIGFVITQSASAIFDPDWYKLENGTNPIAKSAVCYNHGDKDIIYSENSGTTVYQLILTGLSSENGKNAYDRRFTAVMYIKSGDSYTYYALGETSWYEVAAKYRVRNVNYEDFDIVLDAVFNVNGKIQHESVTVGTPLPVLDSIEYDVTDSDITFLGWYDSTLTVKYTAVTKGVTEYYAKYSTTVFDFDDGGMFDPNGRYNKPDSSGIAVWKYTDSPTDSTNRCIKADLRDNRQNTHFALSLFEGSNDGYRLNAQKKYLITFKYYIVCEGEFTGSLGLQVRGSKAENIGTSGGKSDPLVGKTAKETDVWRDGTFYFTTDDTILETPYLIILAHDTVNDVELYIDDLYITELEADYPMSVKAFTDKVTYNDNGKLSSAGRVYIGQSTVDGTAYEGATFIGWYDSELKAPYTRIPSESATLYAKYDSTVLNFENGYLFDPNGKVGSAMSKYDIVDDPDFEGNHVLRASLAGNGNNHNICLPYSGYIEGGYRLKTGSQYTVTFRYKGENLNSNGVALQLRGSNESGIGNTGGKTNPMARTTILQSDEGVWKTASLSFTCNYSDTDYPYLLLLAQDNALKNDSCTATVYFDDIVIKETEPAKTYVSNTVSIGGQSIGTIRPDIVIPDYDFSYLAQMQIEELQNVIKKVTGADCRRIHESESATPQSAIIVGDTADNIIDKATLTSDDYEIRFAGGKAYIGGGSPQALAMGVSEFAKMIENAAENKNFTESDSVSGKYSEKVDDYGDDYYKPTLLEDFDGTEIDETIWKVMGKDNPNEQSTDGWNDKKSLRSPEHTVLNDGKLVISAAYDDQYYYGGMLRSTGNVKYRYGYLENSSILPHGGGLWTAFWTTSVNPQGIYGGEVDINECFGNAGVIAANLHRWPTNIGNDLGYTHTSLDSGFSSAKRKYSKTGTTFNDTFHTYGFYWTEDECRFTCDGDVFFKYSVNGDTVPANRDNDIDAFNEYYSITISMAVGFLSNSNKPVEGADYWNTSNKLIVDYIHLYQIAGQDLIYG